MKSKRLLASIVIPNWNGKHLLKECLPSVFNQNQKNFEVIVVDNGSTDGSQKFIQKNFPQVKLIEMEKKSGFAKPVNMGIKFSRGTLIVLLNNDVILKKDWLKSLAHELSSNKKIGFCAPLILDRWGKLIDSAGDGFSWWGRAYPIGRGKSPAQYQRKALVFGASGGASIFRREVFKKIGLLDEDFYAYFEDVDLCFRAQLAGYQCLYVPGAVCYHRGSATFKRDSFEMRTIASRNKDLVIIKNYPLKYLILKLPKLILAKIRTLAIDFWQGLLFAGLRASFLILISLPKTLIKRKKIQKLRRASNQYLESIINNSHPKIGAR